MGSRRTHARRPDLPWGPSPRTGTKPRAPRQIDPIMSFPTDVSPYGAFDLAGNAWEWTKDWYDARYYQQFRTAVADNPAGPRSSPARNSSSSRARPRTGRLEARGLQVRHAAAVPRLPLCPPGRRPRQRLRASPVAPAPPGQPAADARREQCRRAVLSRAAVDLPPGNERADTAGIRPRPPCDASTGRTRRKVAPAESGLVRLDARVEDLADPVAALLEVGRVVSSIVGVLLVEDLADPLADLLQVQPGQAPGVGRELRRRRRR